MQLPVVETFREWEKPIPGQAHGFIWIYIDLYGRILIYNGLYANGSVQIANGSVRIVNGSVQIANGSVSIVKGSVQIANGSISTFVHFTARDKFSSCLPQCALSGHKLLLGPVVLPKFKFIVWGDLIIVIHIYSLVSDPSVRSVRPIRPIRPSVRSFAIRPIRQSDPSVRPSDRGPGSWAPGSHRIRKDKQHKLRISKYI
jgi:hypothetical protein